MFFNKNRKKLLFEIFDFSKSFEKYFSSKKISFSENFWFYYFLSYFMYNLSQWHRETPTVPPVGAVNVPPKIRKILKIHVFEMFVCSFSWKSFNKMRFRIGGEGTFFRKNALTFFLDRLFGREFFFTNAPCDFLSTEHVFE